MPGSVKSMLKIGLPVTTAGVSTPRVGLPMILKSFGSFSGTVLRAGTGIFAASAPSSPYVALRLLAACITLPDAVVNSVAGTLQRAAAAARIV